VLWECKYVNPLYENIALRKRADDAIAHGALTNSKRPSTFVRGVYPTHIKRGYHSTVVDMDGNRYLDLISGLGTNLFGYGNPAIARAVNHVMQFGGSVFSLGSQDEVQYAEKVKGIFPFIERMRFLKTGSEGCAAALRIARAYTGRNLVISEGYHGWHDEFTSLAEPAHGVPAHDFIYSDKSSWPSYDVAAVIIEPVITDMGPERVKWLQALRRQCDETRTVLIFDETITAFRFPNYCVARYFNILPDLWIGGKAVGGGLPISIVGGKKEIMESDYFVSSTWGGDRTAIAAGSTAINLLHNDFKPDDLWIYGTEFKEKFNSITDQVQMVGYPTRGVFEYKDPMFKAVFMQEMCRSSILIGPSWFMTKFIYEEMDNIISIAKAVVKNINNGMCRLQGEPPQSPFAERVRRC
jgi:glutamate-1-semialdehyde aminotransferase